MNVRTYRSKIQNSPVKRRRANGAKNKSSGKTTRSVSGKSTSTRKVLNKSVPSRVTRSDKTDKKDKSSTGGARVLWTLVCAGIVIGAGFVFALSSQDDVRSLSREETKLKGVLDELSEKQRYELVRKQQTLSTTRSGQIAVESGLTQPKLNDSIKTVSPASTVTKTRVATPTPAPTVNKAPVKTVKKEPVKKEENKKQTITKDNQKSKARGTGVKNKTRKSSNAKDSRA